MTKNLLSFICDEYIYFRINRGSRDDSLYNRPVKRPQVSLTKVLAYSYLRDNCDVKDHFFLGYGTWLDTI